MEELTLRGDPVPEELVKAAEATRANPSAEFATFGHKLFWCIERMNELPAGTYARLRDHIEAEGADPAVGLTFWQMLEYNIDHAYAWIVVNTDQRYTGELAEVWNLGVDAMTPEEKARLKA